MRRLVPILVFSALSAVLIDGCSCSAMPGVGPDTGPGLPLDSGTGPAGDSGPSGDEDICDDGLDNDRDGEIDEDCSCLSGESQQCFHGDPALAGVGACVWGTQYCTSNFEFSEWDVCLGDGAPSAEVCDGVDNNCDGVVDEGCECLTGTERPCYFGPAGTEGVGICHAGVETCIETSGGSAWGACVDWMGPGEEMCDGGTDEDCDGDVDEDCTCTLGESQPCYSGPTSTRGVGECVAGTQTCVAGTGGAPTWGSCMDQTLPSSEVCTGGGDEDCDGLVDCLDPDCAALCCSPYGETLPVIPVEGEILFVIDRSGSMDWPAVGTSNPRWTELKTAMSAVLPMLDSLPMGLLTFPRMDGTSESGNCMVATTPDIPIALGTRASINSRLVTADPRAGDTPTPAAFNTVMSYLTSTSSSRERFVILATDGLPEPNCGATVPATVAAITALRTNLGIDTFVLGIVGPDNSGSTAGIPALQDALNLMADAGGRARPGSTRYYEAGDATALNSSLRAIIAAATDCSFTLSAPPPRPTRITVRQNGTAVPPSSYTLSGTTLTFTGTYCTQIQTGLVSTVSVTDDCSSP